MKPITTPTITGLVIRWEEQKLEADIRRIRRRRDDNVGAEITFRTWAPGYNPHLHNTILNLNSSSSKATLSKTLSQLYNNFNWNDVIEYLAMVTLEYFRTGEPVIEICSDDEIGELKYLLHPLLPLNKPGILFGDGGTGKSLLATFLAITVSIPWVDNPCEMDVNMKPTPSLYLDWESDKDDIAWRMKCIQKGHSLPKFNIHYRHCVLPLAEDIEQIQQAVIDSGAGLVIVDSVGQACGGDLNDAQPAIEMFRALRSLNTTTLLIGHVSKDNSKGKTPYGSAYFRNAARSAWEVRKVQNAGEDELSIGMFHNKTNLSKLFPPIGIRIVFTNDTITFASEDTKTVADFMEELSLSQRITELLKSGPLPTKEIANYTGKSYDVTNVTLKRLSKRMQVIKVGDKWGLLIKGTA